MNGEPANECKLSLHLESTDEFIEAISVSSEFEETFALAPGEDDYYATISCESTRDEYRSATLRLGSPRTYEKGTDLGSVTLSSPALE